VQEKISAAGSFAAIADFLDHFGVAKLHAIT
jgi:hypothetical protein